MHWIHTVVPTFWGCARHSVGCSYQVEFLEYCKQAQSSSASDTWQSSLMVQTPKSRAAWRSRADLGVWWPGAGDGGSPTAGGQLFSASALPLSSDWLRLVTGPHLYPAWAGPSDWQPRQLVVGRYSTKKPEVILEVLLPLGSECWAAGSSRQADLYCC